MGRLLGSAKESLERRRRNAIALPVRGASSGPPTVYFLVPDYDEPSGGVWVIYRQVDLLNESGVSAAVVHQKAGFRCTWFENQTRVLAVSAVRFGDGDLLVVPELDVDLLTRLEPGVRHVVFNQNGHFTWRRGGLAVAAHYRDSPDLVAVVTVSAHGWELLQYGFPRIPVHRVPLGIDPAEFSPPEFSPPEFSRTELAGDRNAPTGAAGESTLRVTYMPRRSAEDADRVLKLLAGRGVLDRCQVTALDGLSHAEVATALRDSDVFLFFTYQEGFGLPAAEAMACGNYVVGFHGFAGREFFRPEFSSPVETGDVLAFARAVEHVVAQEAAEPGWCAARGARAAEFIRRTYSPERERTEVVALYRRLLNLPDPSSPAMSHHRQPRTSEIQ